MSVLTRRVVYVFKRKPT